MVCLLPSLAALLTAMLVAACAIVPEQPQDGPPTSPLVIGVLLPLTGEYAALGQNMLDAAQLAIRSHPRREITIVAGDTKGMPAGARTAARSALAAGAQLLLGPIFAAEVAAVVPIARKAGVTVITFSNDRRLQADDVFVFGLDPEQKIARLAVLAGEKDDTAVALIAPDTAYSRLILDLVRREQAAGHWMVTDVLLYPPQTSFPQMAPLLAQLRLKWEQTGLPDAILLPLDGQALAAVAQMMRGGGPLPQLVALDLEEPVFNPVGDLDGIWYVFPAGERARKRVIRRAIKEFERHPSWMELMAYDAVAVIAERSPEAGAALVPLGITEATAYAGVTGLFRFSPGGQVDRALAVKAIGIRRASTVSPAPSALPPPATAAVFMPPTMKPDQGSANDGTGSRQVTDGT